MILSKVQNTLKGVMHEQIDEVIDNKCKDVRYRKYIENLRDIDVYKELLRTVLEQTALTLYLLEFPEENGSRNYMEIKQKAMVNIGNTLLKKYNNLGA
jgi:hypothetical protein